MWAASTARKSRDRLSPRIFRKEHTPLDQFIEALVRLLIFKTIRKLISAVVNLEITIWYSSKKKTNMFTLLYFLQLLTSFTTFSLNYYLFLVLQFHVPLVSLLCLEQIPLKTLGGWFFFYQQYYSFFTVLCQSPFQKMLMQFW